MQYLGVPIFMGKSKSSLFHELHCKIVKRIDGWKANLFNRYDKMSLLKPVTSSMLCINFNLATSKESHQFHPAKNSELPLGLMENHSRPTLCRKNMGSPLRQQHQVSKSHLFKNLEENSSSYSRSPCKFLYYYLK